MRRTRPAKSSLTLRTKELLYHAAILALVIWLAGCAPAPSASAALTGPEMAIREQIARVCPTPLTADELDANADLVEAHPEAAPAVARLDRFDEESRVCRGQEP